MKRLLSLLAPYNSYIFIVCCLLTLLPQVTPALALFAGLVFALLFAHPYAKWSKATSKYLLQISVVGLGFGMNLHASLQAGKEGMLFTIVSVVSVMVLGTLLAKLLRIDKKTGYLVASGTAICGGSAIAAVAPVVRADDNQISVSLGTVFILNAIALFIFPPIGRAIGLSQEQFGLWAAIAIHDTSSVVGAGAAYGEQALQIATMVKLTRALWIIPLAFVTTLFFKEKGGKRYTPWFIFIFVLAMVANTYLPLPTWLTTACIWIAKKGLTLTLFLIGTSLSAKALQAVGVRPLIQGVLLWIFIALLSLGVIVYM